MLLVFGFACGGCHAPKSGTSWPSFPLVSGRIPTETGPPVSQSTIQPVSLEEEISIQEAGDPPAETDSRIPPGEPLAERQPLTVQQPLTGQQPSTGQQALAEQADRDGPEGTTPNSRPADATARPAVERTPLPLQAVLQSVVDCYPEIEIALGEIESAQGKVLASLGEFDSVFSAHSISQPLGFYQTYRNGAGLTQPLYGGGEVYGTYRIGDGNFEPWFGERETNEGGELKAGFSLPLWKDRIIDARRAALRSANAGRDGVEANVESRLLQFQRFATQAYWDWVVSGQAVQVQQRLLALAEDRVSKIDERVNVGDLARIARIDNDRFIAKRRNDLIKARRLLEKTSIKLSLFYRDARCFPVVPAFERVPEAFPDSIRLSESRLETDTATALAVRPELVELRAARRLACIEWQYANNLTIPKLDMKGSAGQDLGGETSSKGDKTPFELQVGVFAEVPLQRREGLGKIRVAEGKLTQIDAKTRLVADKIRAELQDAASAINAAFDQIRQSQRNVELTRRSLELGRESFDAGDIGLIELNIYETAVADAELQLLDARFKYFFYATVYEVAKSGRAFE